MGGLSFSSLRVRLLLLVLLAIIPAFALILYTGWEQRRHATADAQENALRLAREVSNDHEDLIKAGQQLLFGLAQHPVARPWDVANCTAVFADVLKRFPFYTSLAAATPKGDVYCSSVALHTPVNLADRPYFQHAIATRDFAFSEYMIGRVTGKPTMVIAYPSIDPSGVVRGVVVAGLDLTRLTEHVSEEVRGGTTVLMVDRNGVILARHPQLEKWIGKPAPEAPVVKAILAQREGVTEAAGLEGTRRLFAFTPLRGTPQRGDVYVAIGIAKAEAFAEADRALTRNLMGLGFVAVLALAAAWIGSDLLILRRVDALVGTTRRLAAGDLSARTDQPYGDGELSLLARTFDQMAEALERREAERERAREALRASEARLRLQIERMPIAFITWDPEFRVTVWNPAAEEIFGFSAEEALGKHPYGLIVPKEVQPHVETIWRRLLEADATAHSVNENITKDGRVILCEWSNTPIKQADGGVVGVLSMVQDITERRRVEERQVQLVDALKRSNADLERFAYVASHDLQEPLRMVASFTQLLAKRYQGRLDKDADEFIAFAVDGATRMQRLINDLLAYSRVSTRGKALEPTDAGVALQQALTNLRVALEESQATVTCDPLPSVRADGSQLVQLFQNLIGNALKFRGADPPRIHVSVEREGTDWHFSVRDNGIGIAPEYHGRIFAIFQRLHGKTEYAGTGVGLAICNRIVERHGGRIWVESEPGEGATFYFTLPA